MPIVELFVFTTSYINSADALLSQVFPVCNLVGRRLDKRQERLLVEDRQRATKASLFRSVSGTTTIGGGGRPFTSILLSYIDVEHLVLSRCGWCCCRGVFSKWPGLLACHGHGVQLIRPLCILSPFTSANLVTVHLVSSSAIPQERVDLRRPF